VETKINFIDSDTRRRFIEREIASGEFYRNKDGIILSKEYPENEKNNYKKKFWHHKNYKNKERDHYKVVLNLCETYYKNADTILDVGAGSGYFGRMYVNKFSPKKYVLYDASIDQIKKIAKEFKNQEGTEIQIKYQSFRHISESELTRYDCVISLQVFEYINWDKEFLSKISPGTWVFFSVPSVPKSLSDKPSLAVRLFLTPDSILYRYKSLLDIYEIKEVHRQYHNISFHRYPRKWAIVAQKKR